MEEKNNTEEAGIHFVKEYPTQIDKVEDYQTFIDKYLPEIHWAISCLTVRKGYAISLPQLGIPYNAAVIYIPRTGCMSVVANVESAHFKDNGKRHSIEFDYSVENGRKALHVSRWRKIKAKYDVLTIDADKKVSVNSVEKIMRNTSKSMVPPDAAIIQNVVEHMNPNYMKRYEKKEVD